MQFEGPLIRATLQRRYKRFLAGCTLPDGRAITASCPNTGSMIGCCEPGATVLLSKCDSPTRKYPHTWEFTERSDTGPIGINTARPNSIVYEGLVKGKIPSLSIYHAIRKEVRYGENSRIDLLLSSTSGLECYVEIKNVSLIRKPGLAEFPDCRTERGEKHLRELTGVVADGHRAMMIYLIQCQSPEQFRMAADLDPRYAEAYLKARKAGVEALALTCKITADSIELDREIPIIS